MGRGGSLFAGFVFGPLMVLGGVGLLFWNEGRAVQSARSLAEGAGAVVSVGSDTVDPANEGRLVHVTGRAETDETLTDAEFGLDANAIRLERQVEMFQWIEKRSGRSGAETLEYETAWDDEPVDSSRFEVPEGHANPAPWKWQARTTAAKKVTLGAFRLSDSQASRLPAGTPVEPPAESTPAESTPAESTPAESTPAESVKSAKRLPDGFYIGADPAAAQVGDYRVRFSAALPGDVSVIARQTGDTFAAYQTESGDALSILRPGVHDAAALFTQAVRANTVLTWGMRVFGAFLLFAGFGIFASPLTMLARWVPVLGRVVGVGVAIVSAVLALILGTTTVAIAWLVYRPLIGIPLLLVAIALIVFLVIRVRKQPSATP